jgi:hypothetical protein
MDIMAGIYWDVVSFPLSQPHLVDMGNKGNYWRLVGHWTVGLTC